MKDLRLEHLRVEIVQAAGPQAILRDVTLDVPAGRLVALVGESGAGKSVTAYAIIRLFPTPAFRITGGRILFGGVDLAALPERAMERYRGREIAIVFQEPGSALNPLMTIGDQVVEGIEIHHGRRGARERALEVLRQVGLDDRLFGAYPHQLSGGQRQRALIAAAIGPRPSLLIADEPTSGLDVTVGAQILDLLERLQRETGMSVLLITHSLGLVAQRAALTYVMRRGEIVEGGPTEALFRSPQHPYTRTLVQMAQRL